MSPRTLLFVVAAVFGAIVNATAGEISYLRRGKDPDAAVVADSSQRPQEIRRGEVLADVGRLEEIEDDEIVFERALTDEERKHLRELGLAAPDLQRLHLRRHEGTRAAAHLGDGSAVFSGD